MKHKHASKRSKIRRQQEEEAKRKAEEEAKRKAEEARKLAEENEARWAAEEAERKKAEQSEGNKYHTTTSVYAREAEDEQDRREESRSRRVRHVKNHVKKLNVKKPLHVAVRRNMPKVWVLHCNTNSKNLYIL